MVRIYESNQTELIRKQKQHAYIGLINKPSSIDVVFSFVAYSPTHTVSRGACI